MINFEITLLFLIWATLLFFIGYFYLYQNTKDELDNGKYEITKYGYENPNVLLELKNTINQLKKHNDYLKKENKKLKKYNRELLDELEVFKKEYQDTEWTVNGVIYE